MEVLFFLQMCLGYYIYFFYFLNFVVVVHFMTDSIVENKLNFNS